MSDSGKFDSGTERDGFTFYFGAASGSSRKALRMLEEPFVMLNYERCEPAIPVGVATDGGGR